MMIAASGMTMTAVTILRNMRTLVMPGLVPGIHVFVVDRS